MLKIDRGTVLYVRFFKNGINTPQVINVIAEQIAGIVCGSDHPEKAFKMGTLSGELKHSEKDSIALIKSSGAMVKSLLDLGNARDIDKIELTIVYPDGTTKLGTRSAKNGIGTLIWDDNLIRNLSEMDPEYFWTSDSKTNPAVLVVKDGVVVDRFCDHSQMNGCNSQ